MKAARRTAQDLEKAAGGARPSRVARPAVPANEALAMLARRGLRPRATIPRLPLPVSVDEAAAGRLIELLGHYAFRLFLRGAILHPSGFAPAEATRYVTAVRARGFADALVDLGLAVRVPPDRVRLVATAESFGGTLEWYIARELHRWLGFDAASGVKFHATGVGGDLDVVAAAEGRLVYLEVKSSPPKHVSDGELNAFLDRVNLVRPDVALFVMDTALRLGDKVVPMLLEAYQRATGGAAPRPRRVKRELWAITPHLYAVNGKPDLLANIGCAIAEGLRALSPALP